MYGGEYLSDPKIASLSAQERSCWLTLLSLASISSAPGTIEFLTVEVLLTKSGIEFDPYNPEEWNASLAVLDKFVRMKMISKSDDGVIEILNWVKRQETLMTAAERQAKYRESKKSNVNVTERVTKVTLDKIREDKNINTSVATAPQEERVSEYQKPKREPTAKYPNAKQVFKLFPAYVPALWDKNTTFLIAGQSLHDTKGMEELTEMMEWYQKNRHREFCPQFDDPNECLKKYEPMSRFFDKITS